jgi:hypothetical protein
LPPRDAAAYIDSLTTLMIGYAKAGIMARANAPKEEPLGSETVAFVECPLGVAMRYVWRADHQSRLIPYPQRHEWLRVRDQAERMRWVEVHRNSSMSLGEVIELVYTQRDGHWQPPEQAPTGAGAQKTPAKAQEPKGGQPKVVQVASASSDGARVCEAFQRGRCDRGKRCPHNHVCNVILPNGQMCASKGHGANGHNKAQAKGRGRG